MRLTQEQVDAALRGQRMVDDGWGKLDALPAPVGSVVTPPTPAPTPAGIRRLNVKFARTVTSTIEIEVTSTLDIEDLGSNDLKTAIWATILDRRQLPTLVSDELIVHSVDLLEEIPGERPAAEDADATVRLVAGINNALERLDRYFNDEDDEISVYDTAEHVRDDLRHLLEG